MKKMLLICLITLFVASVSGLASAEEKATEKAVEKTTETKDWKWNVAPFYLWAISITGDNQMGTTSGELNVDFGDILDKLDGAFIINFQGMYKNKWGFMFDYDYISLADSAVIPTNGVPPGAPPTLNASMDLKINIAELVGSYRVDQVSYYFDFFAGGRYTSFAPEVLMGTLYVDKSKSWVDPLVGVRWIWPFAEKWALALSGDIGGFGVGCDFTWQGIFRIDYKPWKNVALTAGYRALYQDYEDGTRGTSNYFAMDATYHGPLLGIEFRW